MGIFVFQLHKPSPGWYTAIIMLEAWFQHIVGNKLSDMPGLVLNSHNKSDYEPAHTGNFDTRTC